jgi:integrase
VCLLDEVPPKWRLLFELLAATGLWISEAIGLRWSDFVLDGPAPHLQVRRAIVKGATVAPRSRHGARLIPLTPELAVGFHPPSHLRVDAHRDLRAPGRRGPRTRT